MVKAKTTFELILDERGQRVVHKEGDSFKGLKRIKVNKGEEVPEEYIQDIKNLNLDLLDVEFIEGVPQFEKEAEKIEEKKTKRRKAK